MQLDALDGAVRSVHSALGPPVQRDASGGPSTGDVHAAAGRGTSGSGARLPHYERIQAAFGRRHDLSDVRAYVGGRAAEACGDMGANGYATGRSVAFARAPSLELAAHEAAHVVQQRSGAVQLSGGVGQAGDRWEQNADAVAARVVQGRSAEDLLPAASGASTGVQRSVQRDEAPAPAPAASGTTPAAATSSASGATPATAATGGIHDSQQKPTDTKAGVEQSLTRNGFYLKIKGGAGGGEVEAGYEKSLKSFPPIIIATGVFIQPEFKVKVFGKGKAALDGSIEVGLAGEISGQATINGGIPGVARIYAGPQITLALTGIKASWPHGGAFKLEGAELALKTSLVVGAQIDALGGSDFLDMAQGAWGAWTKKDGDGKTGADRSKSANKEKTNGGIKLEWTVGGEFELLKVKVATGPDGLLDLHFYKGANVDALVKHLDDLRARFLGRKQKEIAGPSSDEFASQRGAALVPFESKPKAPPTP
ncbi:MAG: DUF4157 domain-containing protein [Deltaproteobacteria bacterium]|nr:DUF4157 domain-containing protein [Deltaproteobacteria bacterium]